MKHFLPSAPRFSTGVCLDRHFCTRSGPNARLCNLSARQKYRIISLRRRPAHRRSMRVMLVYSNRTRIMEPAPPIGLSYVATATRRAGHGVRFVDLMVSRDPRVELSQALLEFRPDVVGFSVRNIDNIIAQRVSWHWNETRA